MAASRQSEIVQILQSDPVVMSVHDVKSTSLGPEFARFKAEILFDGEEITRRYLARQPQVVAELKKAQIDGKTSSKELEGFLIRQGGRIISSLGSEVDRLERKVTDKRPEVKHIDLEIL
jgi:zinc transporter 9